MIIIFVISLLSVYFFHHLYWKRRNLPPGPTPWPFVGNFPSLLKPPPGYVALNRWTKQYGDIYTLWLGSTPYISINSYEKIKETFVKDGDTYSAKKRQEFQEEFRGGSYGVIETNGEVWKTHRRFALMNLRDFGLGKDLMQEKILIEVEDLFKHFDASIGTEVDIPSKFYDGVANVMNQVTFGYRFEGDKYNDFVRLKKLVDYQKDAFNHPFVFIQLFIPAVGKLYPSRSLKNILASFRVDFYAFFNEQIDNHRKKIDFDAVENNDYCEAYLKEQRKREAEGDYESFSNDQLSNMCLDMWFAGLVTTTTTISWALAYILNTPGVEEKIYEELNRVIGSERLITTADKNDLPYINAVINESQRCLNIVPLNTLHETTRDTVINGYPIKKGTGVIAQLSTVMSDEKVFPEPEKFNPLRYIDEKTGKFKRIEEVIPFSIGKRQCLGEGLAKMELFLFISNFLNRYKMQVNDLPSINRTEDTTVTPRNFNGYLKRRHI